MGVKLGVSGSIDSVAPDEPKWGGSLYVESSLTGARATDEYYVTVVVLQSSKVVYQWSQHVGGGVLEFPLIDQDGDGLDANVGKDGGGRVELICRRKKGRGFQITTLDSAEFFVMPA